MELKILKVEEARVDVEVVMKEASDAGKSTETRRGESEGLVCPLYQPSFFRSQVEQRQAWLLGPK